MSQANEIAVPIEWTFVHGAGVIVALAAVVVGVVWSLRHSPAMSAKEKTVWAFIQVVLPILGFALWLIIAARPGKRTHVGENHTT